MGSSGLLRNLVCALARVVLSRLDLDAVFLGGGRDESAYAMRLPVSGLHNLGEGGTLGAGDHPQNLRAFAFGTRGGGLAGGLGGLGFGAPLGTLGAFLGLWRAFLLAGALLRGGLLRCNVRALCRNGGGFVGSRCFCGHHVFGFLFCALFAQDD